VNHYLLFIGETVRMAKELWGDVCQGVGYEEHMYAIKNTIGTLFRVIVQEY
jgi:hypothetical protein